MLDALHIVHQGEDLLILDKPAGLLCVPGRGADKQDCLSTRAQQRWPDALIVHRLDMATSGLVLMARGIAMQRAMSQAFATQQVEKRYEAIVDGLLDDGGNGDDWQDIHAPLITDWPNRPRQIIHPAGKPSHTRWQRLPRQCEPNATRLLLAPRTGRSHQLRVHLASIGHPILGDQLYGSEAVQQRAPRMLLHATRLEFSHPMTGNPMVFESTAPF